MYIRDDTHVRACYHRGVIGVDLGTANVRIHVKGKGVVLREPSVIAVLRGSETIKAVGQEAYEMLGRTPSNIMAVRPMAEGVIADYTLAEKMLKAFIRKVKGANRFIRPNVMVCVPSNVTEVEKRAVLQAVKEVGARKAFLIEEPIAGAIGSGIDIAEPVGSMVIDIGGGTADVAVISLGGIVVSESIRVAGDTFDEDIIRYIRQKENMLIGKRTAEEIKVRVGAAMIRNDDEISNMEVRGRDLVSGLPKTISVDTNDVVTALSSSLRKIAEGLKRVLESAPPELIADVIERGIVLMGGGALLRNIDLFFGQVVQIPIAVAEQPMDCIAIGTGKALDADHLHVLQDALTQDTLQHYVTTQQ